MRTWRDLGSASPRARPGAGPWAAGGRRRGAAGRRRRGARRAAHARPRAPPRRGFFPAGAQAPCGTRIARAGWPPVPPRWAYPAPPAPRRAPPGPLFRPSFGSVSALLGRRAAPRRHLIHVASPRVNPCHAAPRPTLLHDPCYLPPSFAPVSALLRPSFRPRAGRVELPPRHAPRPAPRPRPAGHRPAPAGTPRFPAPPPARKVEFRGRQRPAE